MDVDEVMDSSPILMEYEALLQHVILPRELPQEKSSHLYTTEFDLMNQMVKNVENLAGWIPSKTVQMFRRLRSIHAECTPENISLAISSLEPGDTFAMFIRPQFCAIMIHVPANERPDVQNVIVASVTGSLHPKEIYQHDSDIKVT